jgi:WD40 repeat protein
LQHKRRLWALAFSPDSKTILTGSWDPAAGAQLWDVSTGKPLGEPISHPDGYVNVVAFSPDAKTILLAGGGTQLIEAATGKQLHSLGSFNSGGLIIAAAFSPDGKSAVTGSQETKFARLWDVTTGKPIGKPMPHERTVGCVTFSPDSKTVLTASADKTARLWEAATGEPLGPAFKHQGGVSDAAFSPDGKTILTASNDGTARLWQLPTPVTGDAERIVLWTQVITGLELDSDDLIRVLDATTWQQRRQRLQELGGPPL